MAGPIRNFLQNIRERRERRRFQNQDIPEAVARGQDLPRTNKGYAPGSEPETPLSDHAGGVDPETGEATAPDTLGRAEQKLDEMGDLAAEEHAGAQAALDETQQDIDARSEQTEADIAAGKESAEDLAGEVSDITDQAKQDVADLPDEVQADIQGIADKYKEQTDVDIDRIEGLGLQAVQMAMDGKNAAAQAAVQGQQAAMRNAIAQINADPNIPQSRKTALISQIQTQSSMQIASTIGANIKDFTAMQVGAMRDTMNAVGAASVARNQSLAAMGQAEIGAVASAHETAAQISAGMDTLKVNALQNLEQLQFQYDNMASTYRQHGDSMSLAMFDNESYVLGMPYDFAMNDFALGQQAIMGDFELKLKASGYNTMREAAEAGEDWAREAFNLQMMAEFLPGNLKWLGGLISLFGGGRGGE